MSTRTGIFSGSFNPIHIGHLALANWLCEYGEMDEVWFLVTPHNPLKQREQLIDDNLRLDMARAATEGYPRFKVCDIEFGLPKPSYTIDTMEALERTYPDREFSLIIGADNWQKIDLWKHYQTLIDNHRLLVYPRNGYKAQISATCPNVKLVNAPLIEISSTFIRESYKQGRDVRFFLPEPIRTLFKEIYNKIP